VTAWLAGLTKCRQLHTSGQEPCSASGAVSGWLPCRTIDAIECCSRERWAQHRGLWAGGGDRAPPARRARRRRLGAQPGGRTGASWQSLQLSAAASGCHPAQITDRFDTGRWVGVLQRALVACPRRPAHVWARCRQGQGLEVRSRLVHWQRRVHHCESLHSMGGCMSCVAAGGSCHCLACTSEARRAQGGGTARPAQSVVHCCSTPVRCDSSSPP